MRIHDLPDPVGVLRSARRMVKPGGTVLVMDERVPEEFTGPGDTVEQLMYGISMLVCLPDGLPRRVGRHRHGYAPRHAAALRP